VPEAFWLELEGVAREYDGLRGGVRRNLARDRRRYTRIDKLVSALANELRAIRNDAPRLDSDLSWPARDIEALWRIHDRASAHLLAYESIAASQSRRSDPCRDYLIGGLLDLWMEHVDATLGFSRAKGGEASGPLIRFLDAAAAPLLGDAMLKPEGLASRITKIQPG
jgi:hypothetical protein